MMTSSRPDTLHVPGLFHHTLSLFRCTQASKKLVLNATLPVGPYRYSHLDLEAWIKAGYTADLTADYLRVVREKLCGQNLALHLRIPHSFDIRYMLVIAIL